MDEQKYNHIMYIIKNISIKTQTALAKTKGYTGKEEKSDLIDFFMSLEDKIFDDLVKDYKYSARTTNYLFVLEKVEELKQILNSQLNQIFKKYKKDPSKLKETSKEIVYVDEINYLKEINELHLSIVEIKTKDIVQSFNFTKLIEEYFQINSINITPVRIYLDLRLLVIRATESGLANRCIAFLSEINENFAAHELIFKNENKISLIDKLILRTSSFRFGDEETGVETAKFGIGVDKQTNKLLDLKKSERYKNAKEKGDIKYITLSANRDINDENGIDGLTRDDCLSFLVNFDDSKVHFYPFMYEDEIKYWLGKIIEECEISMINPIQDDIDDIIKPKKV